MKKALSVLLSVAILVGVLSVVFTLPSMADPARENLIVNGDASGVLVGGVNKTHYTEDDRGEGAPNNANLGFTYYYTNGRYGYNAYGWRNNGTTYGNVAVDHLSAMNIAPAGYFRNYSASDALRVNNGQYAMQDIEIEANKTYTVSAKVTLRPYNITSSVGSAWTFDMFIDPAYKSTAAPTSLPSGESWNLVKGHTLEGQVNSWLTGTTETYEASDGNTYRLYGDYVDYSFTFSANEFIEEHGLTALQNGKYGVRFVLRNGTYGWLMFDDVKVTEVYEVFASEGGYYTGTVKDDGQSVTTVTAVPYYGNTFDGWYTMKGDLLTKDATYSAVLGQSVIARFNRYNLINDGDYESGDPNIMNEYSVYPNYDAANRGTYQIGSNPISGTEDIYGEKSLVITPAKTTSASKAKALLNIPVQLTGGKKYIWKFSYAFPKVPYETDLHYIHYSVDKPDTNGKIIWGGTVEYSMHVQHSTTPGIEENPQSWGTNVYYPDADKYKDAFLRSWKISATDCWMHVYVIADIKTTGTYYLSLGTPAGCMDTVVFDNMSLTEATNTETGTVVTVEGGGNVTSYRDGEAAYYVHDVQGAEGILGTKEEAAYYGNMYVTYSAAADRGYLFDGWFDQSGRLVSSDKTVSFRSVGGKYVARFSEDPDRFRINTQVESGDTLGGYIIDNSEDIDYFRNDKVVLTAVPYKGNAFLGWYDGNGLLSAESTYTHTIVADATITARFANNNLFADAGLENTDTAVSVWGEDKEFYTTSDPTDTSGVVISTDAFDGEHSLIINAPAKEIVKKAVAVEAGKKYHLSFAWRTTYSYTDDGKSGLASVKVIDAATGTIIAKDDTFNKALGESGWQQFSMNFDTGTSTSVKVVIVYDSVTSAIFLDDMALFDTEKQGFVIKAQLTLNGDVFPGYLTCEREAAYALGESVSVSAVAYSRNKFLGWYENGELVSESAVYTFSADRYRTLSAAFETENLLPDAGFENTAAGTECEGELWQGKVSGGAFTVSNKTAYDGENSLEVSHRNKSFGSTLTGLKAKTHYVLSFRWKMASVTAGEGFRSVAVNGATTRTQLALVNGTESTDGWQQIIVSFNTDQNTEVNVEYLYESAVATCFIDDVCLYESNDIKALAAGGGTVISTHTGPVDDGISVTVTATPDGGNTFLGWYDYENANICYSTEPTYTFTVDGTRHLIAYFEGPTAEKINYFVDGDFENGNFAGVEFSHPWSSVKDDKYSVVSKTDAGDAPVSGSNMLRVTANGHYSIIMLENLKPSTDYTLSFWWNIDEGTSLRTFGVLPYYPEMMPRDQDNNGKTRIKYAWYDSDAFDVMVRGSGVYVGRQHYTGKWRKVEISFNSLATTTNFLHISAAIVGLEFYLDDIRLYEGSGGYSNALVNGDFSDAKAENGWLTEYSEEEENGNKFAVTDGTLKQNLLLDFTTAYTLKFKARSETAASAELIYGFTYGGTDTLTTENALSNVSYDRVTLSDGWEEYTLSFLSGIAENYSFYIKGENGVQFAVDDVTLTKATDTVPVQTFTFEDTEEKYPFANNRDFDNAVRNNKDWFEFTTEESHTGNGSLKMKYRANFAIHELMQDWSTLRLDSGKTYRLSFWAKSAQKGNEFALRVKTMADGWVHSAVCDKTFTLDSAEWTEFTVYFTVNHIDRWGGKTVSLILDGVENGTVADIWFDDFRVEESERTIVDTDADKLYTMDISQNYFSNYDFENDGDVFTPYVKTGDAFYGDRYITVNAGDRIVLPVNTRVDWDFVSACEYTFAASLRGDGTADGTVALSYSSDGNKLLKTQDGKDVTLSVNTGGRWKRTGYTFAEQPLQTLYLVIECENGSFDVDYLSLFDTTHAFAENTHDETDYSFDENDPENYVDASAAVKENYITGSITDLPSGSHIVLKGENVSYKSVVDSITGAYEIRNIENGTYSMFVVPGGELFATMWGDMTFKNGTVAGLASERLSGTALEISGRGVSNGVVKVVDDFTDYGYLTRTDDDGEYTAYILDSGWYIEGTTTDTEILDVYTLTLADFGQEKLLSSATAVSPDTGDSIYVAVAAICFMLAVAALVIFRKKGAKA